MRLTVPAKLWGLITHILVYLGGLLLAGGMTLKDITSLCCLSTFAWIFPAISVVHFLAIRLSGHNFLVQRMRPTSMSHNGNRRPYYSIRICDKCDWHSVQDEEHILLDCPYEHLGSLRTRHRQLVFPPQFEDSPTRLRTFLNQPYGVASIVAERKKKRLRRQWKPLPTLFKEKEPLWYRAP